MSKVFFILMWCFVTNFCFAQNKKATVTVMFDFVSKGDSNILNKTLTNTFGERYTLSKLKFYVSHLKFMSQSKERNNTSVYLIDAAKTNQIIISVPIEKITGISFLLGIDSLLNCSGAQSGSLDPLNDMFWTWSNGYIVFKMEGTSTSSTADLQRLEYHIGGYKGENKVLREIFLPINSMSFLKTKKLTLQLDMDKYWDGINKLKIEASPVIRLPGEAAKNIADNFIGMFLLK